VTGGGKGIGFAIAETFAREGAHVLIADSDGEAAEAAGRGIAASSGTATARTVDVSDTGQVKCLMAAIGEKFGRLDVLVNNAGVGVGRSLNFHNLTDQDWRHVWRVNVNGVVRCAREAFKLLRVSGHASVINLSSVMATKHTGKMSVYSASKGAITALSQRLAVEYAPYGIRVNCVCPGYVGTAMTSRFLTDPTIAKFLLGRTPMGRFGVPQDVANAALFLASDDAACVTGASLPVDGGMSVTL